MDLPITDIPHKCEVSLQALDKLKKRIITILES
jgi:hypothetical protein